MTDVEDHVVKRWWRQLAFDMPRARTHSTSRLRVTVVLLSMLGVVLLLAAGIGLAVYLDRRYGSWRPGGLMAGVTGLGVFVWRTVQRRRRTLTLKLSDAPSPKLRDSLQRYRTLLTVLVARAAYETRCAGRDAPAEGDLPAQQIRRLRQQGVSDSAPQALKDLLAEPAGSWHRERIRRILLQLEAIEVLSWALRKDYPLPSLRIAGDAGPGRAPQPVLCVESPPDKHFVRSRVEIERQMTPVSMYLAHLRNELIRLNVAGGEFDPSIRARIEDYMTYAASLGEVDVTAEDLPIGDCGLVVEAAADTLLNLRSIAAIRFLTLDAIRSAYYRGDPAVFDEQVGWMTERITLHM